MNTALIIVDVQHDFCPGGALGTDRGNEVAEKISSLQTEYDTVVATQDWHIDPGSHFAEDPDFVDSWPVHCVADSYGAQMHEAIGLRKHISARVNTPPRTPALRVKRTAYCWRIGCASTLSMR